MKRLTRIEGTITLDDGSERQFLIGGDELGWHQWGARPAELGDSVHVLEALVYGLMEESVPHSQLTTRGGV